jgi:hypothetical protein
LDETITEEQSTADFKKMFGKFRENQPAGADVLNTEERNR